VQTRPGNEPEPEREPEESGDERDPFTPKVRPGDESEPEGGEDAGEAEEGEEGEEGDGEQGESAEAEPAKAESAKAEPEEPSESGKRGEALAETVDMRGLLPESGEPDERGGRDLAETVDMRGQLPEEPAGAEPEEREGPDLAETVDMRGLPPEEPAGAEGADESPAAAAEDNSGEGVESAEEPAPRRRSGEQSGEGDQEPGPRRRSGEQPAEGEPRRRPAPGGQPQRPGRRPEPGQDPRRGAGRPHANHASPEPGPKRRPSSEHGPDHAAKRRPGPESHAAAAYAMAAASPPGAPAGKGGPGTPKPPSPGRRRLIAAFWPPRLSRNQAVVGVLLAALGAALAIQVRATNTSDQILRGARNDDLVNILDEVTSRGQSLDSELRNLETQNAAIQDSADKAQAALTQAQQKARDLQILAGTVKAKGNGITMTITDPQSQLKSATLLNALEELRAAGAEVIQIDDVRVVVSSSLVDTPDGGIALDGHELAQPYIYKVIGDPNTLGPAMQIPGGVVATVKSQPGANVTITPGQVLVDAVAPQPNPQYAKAG
jgi:uncharacterized protein YlxW (UPF0749 family)